MKKTLLSLICTAGLCLSLSACAAPPIIQAAGMGMTGYDAVMFAREYAPKDRIDPTLNSVDDQRLAKRMDERLEMKGFPRAEAYVFNRNAYLIGEMKTQAQAKRATEIASTVKGIEKLTVRFFPAGDLNTQREDDRLELEVIKVMKATPGYANSNVDVAVIRGNAVVMGLTRTEADEASLLTTIGKVNGLQGVVDYVTVTPNCKVPQRITTAKAQIRKLPR